MRRTLGFALALSALPAVAAEDCTQDAMVVFDGSGSMSETGFNALDLPRILEARVAVRRAMPHIAPFRRLGLIVYGPGAEDDACRNIDLRFPPVRDAAPRILAAVDALEPDGETPLTASVQEAAEVLDYRNRPGVVVLVTDGKETCDGSPCTLAAELAADAQDLTVHVIGFKMRGDFFSWESQGESDYTDPPSVARCLADRTGGLYLSTETVDELAEALEKTLGCTLVSALPPVPLFRPEAAPHGPAAAPGPGARVRLASVSGRAG